MNTSSIYKSTAGKNEIMALYDAVLARWPVAHETATLSTRQGDTFVIASGDKSLPPVILLHGAASNAVSWVGDVAAYCEHFRVFAIDLPGEAGKSSENRPFWQGPEFSEWLEDVLDRLSIDRTALVGISQGGWTAIRFASLHPQRVSKLVLLAPAGVAPTRSSFIWKSIAYSMFSSKGGEKINRMVIGEGDMHPEAIKFMDAIMTHFKARLEKEYIFTDEELKQLTMPTLLIGGTDDALIAVEKVIPRMGRLLPQFKAEEIPGMGHALVNLSAKVIPFLMP